MRTAPYLTFAALMSASTFAQTAPTVSNVHASQRNDGSRMVDIRYDLAHNAACTVWPVLSGDGGVSWSVPAMTLMGDVGPGVTPGTNRHIVWDAAADIPGVVGTYRARVYADDGSTVSNMVFVPAGAFPYQNNVSQLTFVGSFFIDKYEITNQRYAEFLNGADPDGTHWDASMEITRSVAQPHVYYAVNPGRSNYPIRYISAIDAEAYAAWLSARDGRTYRLPTEQEWEKASAWDPTINRHWNYAYQIDALTCSSANVYGCLGTSTPTEVGHYNGTNGTNNARSFYGCYDMTGNVWEWTSSETSEPTCNPLPLRRVARGGAYDVNPQWNYGAGVYFLSTTGRCTSWGDISCAYCFRDDQRLSDGGFRLALDPD